MKWLRWIFLAVLVIWGSALLWALYAQLTIQQCSAGQPLQAILLAIAFVLVALGFSAWLRPRSRKAKFVSLFLGFPCSLVLAFLGVLPMESVFVLDPSIDTRSAPDFSSSAFAQIEPGFTAPQVLDLIGEPLSRNDQREHTPGLGPRTVWVYSVDGACSWCDAAYRDRAVVFADEVVVKTWEQWYCN